jgi:hypothetical protein
MEEFIQRFESDFTLAEFPHGMFYKFDIGLRFELGGEENPTSRPLKRFAQAFSRADAVSSSLFKNHRRCGYYRLLMELNIQQKEG